MSNLQLFGTAHLLILLSVPVTAAALAWVARQSATAARRVRLGAGAFLLANVVLWYGYTIRQGWLQFPLGLPFELCDAACLLAIYSAFTLHRWSYDLVYYWSLAGTTMAILTPDLWEPFPSYPTVQFFIAHNGVVVIVLLLLWGKMVRPRRGSWWKALLWLGAYTVAVGSFNAAFDTNYMYLRHKPASASLLDYFGPWPVYVLVGTGVAALLFYLLHLPFRHPRES